MLKRQGQTVDVDLDNIEFSYFADVSLGTPAQKMRLHLDTGSSEMWVNVPSSQLCSQSQSGCVGGTYSASSSSTYKSLNSPFNVSYVDGSGASGDYVTDSLDFGGITLQDFQFGTGNQSTASTGVLGIGYTTLEFSSLSTGKTYPNLPQALKNAGHIVSNVYSLWLNDLDSSTGEILFGGVDKAKFTGTLSTLPIVPLQGSYLYFLIGMSGLSANGQNITSSELPLPVLLDSGSTLTYLPSALAEEVYSQVNAVLAQGSDHAVVSCDLANQGGNFEFDFSGAKIRVPYDEMVLDTDGGQLQNGERACAFGIFSTTGHVAILGDTFLRSAYVVYDLENNEISLAQTVFNTTSEDVESITTSGGAVPGAVKVSDPVDVNTGSTSNLPNSPNAASVATSSIGVVALISGITAFLVDFS